MAITNVLLQYSRNIKIQHDILSKYRENPSRYSQTFFNLKMPCSFLVINTIKSVNCIHVSTSTSNNQATRYNDTYTSM